jgi:hypothetical protein
MPAATQLPDNDPVFAERTIAGAIAAALATVSNFGPVQLRPRYVSEGASDEAVTTTDDPVMGDNKPITNFCEIGIPQVGVIPYASNDKKMFTFVYPITYKMAVVDSWDKTGFPFKSSPEMLIGLYMLAEKALAQDRTLGISNCEHNYLQQDFVGDDENEEGEALNHRAEWSLTIIVTDARF